MYDNNSFEAGFNEGIYHCTDFLKQVAKDLDAVSNTSAEDAKILSEDATLLIEMADVLLEDVLDND